MLDSPENEKGLFLSIGQTIVSVIGWTIVILIFPLLLLAVMSGSIKK